MGVRLLALKPLGLLPTAATTTTTTHPPTHLPLMFHRHHPPLMFHHHHHQCFIWQTVSTQSTVDHIRLRLLVYDIVRCKQQGSGCCFACASMR
jgi:hypothetical protein